MMTLVSQVASLQEFLQLPTINESPRWEFVDQMPSQKPMPTFYHSRLQKRLVGVIDQQENGYEAFPELRCVLSENSVVPDVSVVAQDRFPTGNDPLKGAPNWGIEILSPNQSTTKVITNIQLCLQSGMELGWLIDPMEEVILVFWRNRAFGVYREQTVLPVLNAMTLTLTPQQIFAWKKS